MLNEVSRLWQSLATASIPVESQHPLIKPLPSSAKHLLRVRLAVDGMVSAVEDVADDERTALRRIVQTSDGSFPVLKANEPILNIAESDPMWAVARKRNQPDSERIALLESCLQGHSSQPWDTVGHNWVQSRAKATLLSEKLAQDEAAAEMVTLGQRFCAALEDPIAFTGGIATSALTNAKCGLLSNLRAIEELLIGKGKDRAGRDKKISVLLVLDLDDMSGSRTRIYTRQMWRRVADVLPVNLAERRRHHKHRAERAAFGTDSQLWVGPFPQVKLPVLGAYFPLVSMASDGDKAKCNKRYGLTEHCIVPVGEQAALRMQDALTWIVDADREGHTWRGVANGRFEKDSQSGKKREQRDLLIAFLEEKPDIDARTASYFGSGANVVKAKFEGDASAIARAINADPQVRPHSKLALFVLRKASDGQAQITLAESPTVKQVLDRADQWVLAVKKNTPHVRLFLPQSPYNEEELRETDGEPLSPYPDQVVRLLSYQWVRDGSSPKKHGGKPEKPNHEVIGPGLAEVLAVMLRTEGKWEPAARRLLALLVQRVTPLLIGVFGAKHVFGPWTDQGKCEREPLNHYPRESREIALRAVAVTGILLDALDCHKENYMKEAAYQVGQLLALADTLHKDYCIVVRRQQLPNSLIGTALMRHALENPVAAVADLSERMMEYVRWAKTVSLPKEKQNEREEKEKKEQMRIAVHEARKKLRQFEPLAAALARANLPTETNDLEKAQLILGFLASPPHEEQDSNGKDDSQ